MRYFIYGLLVIGCFITLAGCGGGGDNSSPKTNGSMVVYSSKVDDPAGDIYVVRMLTSGVSTPIRITSSAQPDFHPVLSANGMKVAYVEIDASSNPNIWTVALDVNGYPIEASRQQVTNDALVNDMPAWSPDGSRLLFVRGSGQPGIYEKNIPEDGQSPVMVIADAGNPCYSPVQSSLLAFSKKDAVTNVVNLYTLNLNTGGTPTKITQGITDTDFAISGLTWSPDGTKLAFGGYSGASNGNLYVVNAVATSTPQAITSADDNGGPVWLTTDGIVFFSNKGIAAGRHALYTITPGGGGETLLLDDTSDISRHK